MRPTRFWPLFFCLCLAGYLTFPASCQVVGGTPDAPSAPASHQAGPATVPLNGIYRAAWDIGLGRLGDGSAYETRIPYSDVLSGPTLANVAAAAPGYTDYLPNLRHNEDVRNGVTVSAVLTPPGGGAAHTYPCYYAEDMTDDLAAQGGGSLAAPTGYAGWHLAFPCKAAGNWVGYLHVTDAGGESFSPSFAFTVAGALTIPDAAKGRLSLNPASPRVLRYDDGDGYFPMGQNANAQCDPLPHLAAASAAHTRLLLRDWISRFGGTFPLTGGPDGDTNQGTTTGLYADDAHSGRFSYQVTSLGGNLNGNHDNNYFSYYSPVGQAEVFGVWVKDRGAPAGSSVGITQYGGYGTGTLTTTDVNGADIHDGAWHYVRGTLGAAIVADKKVFLTVSGSSAGDFLFDDLTIVEASHAPLVGTPLVPGSAWDLLGGEGTYELQNTLDWRGCADLTALLDRCRAADANALIEMFSTGDHVAGTINADGGNGFSNVNYSGGDNMGRHVVANGSYASGPSSAADDGCETAGGLLRLCQVRAFVAEFGCYCGQGVALVSFGNEYDPGPSADNGAAHWACQMRNVAPADCLPLCGQNFYTVQSGQSLWPWPYYEDPYLQWAEVHTAPAGSIPSPSEARPIPYDLNVPPYPLLYGGLSRQGGGGPFGGGYLESAAGTGSGHYLQLPSFRIPSRWAGRPWTLTAYAETAPDGLGAVYSTPAGSDPDIIQLSDVAGQSPFAGGLTYSAGLHLSSVTPTWTRLTASPVFAAAGTYPGVMLQVYGNHAAGLVRWAGVTLKDPDGRTVWQSDFSEPLLNSGAGDADSIFESPFDADLSGRGGAQEPVVIGEDEAYSLTTPPITHTVGALTSNSAKYPVGQEWYRAAAALVDPRAHVITSWLEDSQWQDATPAVALAFADIQKLLDGFVAQDGTWAGGTFTQEGYLGIGEPFAVYGQTNSRDSGTGLIVPATRCIFSALPNRPASDNAISHLYQTATGLVDVKGLSDGDYSASAYDLTSPLPVATFTAHSSNSAATGGDCWISLTNISKGLTLRLTHN